VLLSNAPRPFPLVVPHMTSLGVEPRAYDGGVTSGDATRDMIAAWQGKPLLHIGPERDLGLFEGFDVRLVPPEEAQVVVCSGLYDDTRETPADYAGLFAGLLERNVPMICANPDIMVERGHELIYCAGALADYEAKGGR
jgi:ribonucleotide monophosphatase NagD (HAD superfamily)